MAVFILIGLATTLPRASFIVLGSRVALPPVLQRALRYAPAAALAAIVAPDVLVVGGAVEVFNPKLADAGAALGRLLINSSSASIAASRRCCVSRRACRTNSCRRQAVRTAVPDQRTAF